jgi:hypothetical protein
MERGVAVLGALQLQAGFQALPSPLRHQEDEAVVSDLRRGADWQGLRLFQWRLRKLGDCFSIP